MKKGWVSLAVAVLVLTGCDVQITSSHAPPEAPQKTTKEETPRGALEIVFPYGSEKEEWIKAVTRDYNAQKRTSETGKPIHVKALPMGSGESIDLVLDGSLQAHLVSPASGAFIKLGNAKSRVQTGKDLIGPTENLVLSPVVIAIWKPMAESLGWPEKAVGWAEILALAENPKGWAAYGHPEWGQFKFGHTHPEYSNSGLISLLAEVYAATGKKTGLTLADVEKPSTAAFLAGIERAVVHYGSSTGFFGKKMFSSGPEYLSAAVLYENMVIESYSPKYQLPFPIVAIYPKEGTFWSDHPAGVVQREWVTPEHAAAAQDYVAFLLEKAQQERALEFGFRPASLDVPLGPPIDEAHGVNPREPQTTLEVPSAEVMDAILRLWDQNKKRSRVALVFDISGSMRDENKIDYARQGALELVKNLDDRDEFALAPFNSKVLSAAPPSPLGPRRESVNRQISGLFANGGTALYDAVGAANARLLKDIKNDRIQAVVVLSDGQDTNSAMRLEELIEQIKATPERESVRIFVIGYGSDAEKGVLKRIAEASQAKFYEGTTQNIREVFKDISTFF